LKVAEIKEVNDHPDADKLYVMQIDLGEKRQLVASIKPFYKKEELLGKKIIVVSNLKPAKFRGVRSEGMLLAVENAEDCGVLFVEKAKAGSIVKVEGYNNKVSQIKYDDFAKLDIKVEKGKVIFDGKVLKVNGEEVKVDKFDEGKVC
jgi:tRNA-binding EMAP/Myf-like protein